MSYAAIGMPMNGVTRRLPTAYAACSAKIPRVNGQTQAMTWIARPFRIEAAVIATTVAGAMSKPPSAVTPRKNRGARRSCAICPARNTSPSRTSAATTQNPYGNSSLRRTSPVPPQRRSVDESSAAGALLASHLARGQSAREYVQRLLRIVRRQRENVEQHQVLGWKRVRRHVAIVEEQH